MEQKQGKVQIDENFYNYLLFDNNKLISLYETKNQLIIFKKPDFRIRFFCAL